jgi:hypothetical protein
VLLIMTLVVMGILDRSGISSGFEWVMGVLLLVGGLAQPGGMFVHMAVGQPGTWSRGNTLSVAGAVVLAAALLPTAYAVIVG